MNMIVVKVDLRRFGDAFPVKVLVRWAIMRTSESVNLIHFGVFIIICCSHSILATKGSAIIDRVHQDCLDNRKLNQVCYGWSFADEYQCLKTATCEYLVLVDTPSLDGSKSVPPVSDVPLFVTIGDEELTISLFILSSQSNGSFNVWLTNENVHYLYTCDQIELSTDSNEASASRATWKSTKKANPMPFPGTDSFISGCSWSVSKMNSEWPLDEKQKPIDLINSHYWLMLGPTAKEDNGTSSHTRTLPIYRFKYLYQDCDERTKFCYGSGDCVASSSCSELLVVKVREYDSMYLDFLFLVLDPREGMSYKIDINPSKRILNNDDQLSTMNDRSLSLRSQCDQKSCRHKIILPNGGIEMKMNENLLAHSYNQLIESSRKYIWSFPLVFEVDGGSSFNGRNTMHRVTIKSNNLTLVESKIPGLPGYSLRDEIYKECETINESNEQSASSSICFGFNKDNRQQECLKCSTCSMVAILRPKVTLISSNKSHHGVDHEALELELYGQDGSTSIGLYFIYNIDDGSSFGYRCVTSERSQSKEMKMVKKEESGQKISQNANVAFGSIYCNFIISGDRNTWPTKKNGETVNLIKDEIPIEGTWNHYAQLVDPNGSHNPIHRFKYLYDACSKRESVLCIGFNDCIAHRNCTNLVVIEYEHGLASSSKAKTASSTRHRTLKRTSSNERQKDEEDSHGLLNWAVYSADDSDSLVVSFSGDNLFGDDYAIMCTPNGFAEHYIWETGKLKPIRETVVQNTHRSSELIPGSGLGGFRCFWTMPGLFSVFFANYRFDVITDTVYMNLTFQKDKRPTHMTRIFTTLPGFRGNKPNSGPTFQPPSIVVFLFVLLLNAVYPIFPLN